MSGKKVFISYSHDSGEHRDKVLALSERLRQDGIETFLDQYVNGSPRKGWPRWMLDQLDAADSVVVVCTETYYRRFRGHELPGKGRGVDWEGALITQEIYESRSTSVKFVPVFLGAANEDWIPEPIRSGTFYTLVSEDSYLELYDFLLGVAGVEARPVGPIKPKQRRSGTPLTFDDGPGEDQTTGGPSPGPSKVPRDAPPEKPRTRRIPGGALQIALISAMLLLLAGFMLHDPKHDERDLEFEKLKKIVEEIQKGVSQPLDPQQIEQEAELRKEEPQRFRSENLYWPNGCTIRIAFLDGEEALHDKVFSVAKEWTKYANLTFLKSAPAESDVRVSFDEPGEWSFMGTQCLSVPKNEKTTNLGIDFEAELESRQFILHSFGHVLGLIHEHQTPSARSLFNLEKAKTHYAGPPNFWDTGTVATNFQSYDDAGPFYEGKPYDPYSVMLYEFPADILNQGTVTEPGDQLSPGDIALIKKIYPGKK